MHQLGTYSHKNWKRCWDGLKEQLGKKKKKKSQRAQIIDPAKQSLS